MDDFTASASKPNFRMKLWRGERMCLLGFDVAAPEPDFVGFASSARSRAQPISPCCRIDWHSPTTPPSRRP